MGPGNPRDIRIEHPSGVLDLRLETEGSGPTMKAIVGTVRTARPIMRGEVLVPSSALEPAQRLPAAAE